MPWPTSAASSVRRQSGIKTPSNRSHMWFPSNHPGSGDGGRRDERLFVSDLQRPLEQLRIPAHATGELHLNHVFAGSYLGPAEKTHRM